MAAIAPPKRMLLISKKFMLLSIGHDARADIMFQVFAENACVGVRTIVTCTRPITLLISGTYVCQRPFLGNFAVFKSVARDVQVQGLIHWQVILRHR